MEEEYRVIEGFQVSNFGNVIGPKGWILKPRNDKRWGYYSVQLCNNGMEKKMYIHRLLLYLIQRINILLITKTITLLIITSQI